MAEKKKNSGQFTSRNRPPPRGKAFKTKLIEAIRRRALLEVASNASAAKVEEQFLAHVAERAFDKDDFSSATLLKELLSKSYASIKPTLPEVEFEFDTSKSAADQVAMIISASAQGKIPPDVAAVFVGVVKSAVDIQAATDLKDRIAEIERVLGVQRQ